MICRQGVHPRGQEQVQLLHGELVENALVEGLEILEAEQVRRLEPEVSENVVAALHAPSGVLPSTFSAAFLLPGAASKPPWTMPLLALEEPSHTSLALSRTVTFQSRLDKIA